MNWLLLSYFLTVGTMNYQAEFIGPTKYDVAEYLTPKGTFTETLGVELTIADIAFVGGQVETWENTGGSRGMFSPSQSFYTFNAGVRKNGLEIGWKWECYHMTLPGFQIPDQGFGANKSSIYLSYHGSVKLF